MLAALACLVHFLLACIMQDSSMSLTWHQHVLPAISALLRLFSALTAPRPPLSCWSQQTFYRIGMCPRFPRHSLVKECQSRQKKLFTVRFRVILFFKGELSSCDDKTYSRTNSIPVLISHSKGKFTDKTAKKSNGRTAENVPKVLIYLFTTEGTLCWENMFQNNQDKTLFPESQRHSGKIFTSQQSMLSYRMLSFQKSGNSADEPAEGGAGRRGWEYSWNGFRAMQFMHMFRFKKTFI